MGNNTEGLSSVPGHDPRYDLAYTTKPVTGPTKEELMLAYPKAVSVSQARRLHLSGAKPAYYPPALPSHEERRRIIEAPFPTINIWGGRTWGGLSKREGLIPDAGKLSWSRTGREDYSSPEED